MTAADWATIYRRNIWNGVESRSGPGSGPVATRNVVPELLRIVSVYGIRSVLDGACGDGAWMPDLPGYVGIDRSPVAILLHHDRHPERRLAVADIRDWRGKVDLVILRDCIQHLTLDESMGVVHAAREHGRYLLASSYVGGTNTGIGRPALLRGGSYANDLEGPPFSLGAPLEVIPDGWSYDEPVRIRDATKVLALWAS